ncbi:hypothetical protein HDU76_001849 [Blyttiomyces sp. JEL0837]|nr:hypothetical protein HDU76_001849 [Blyttiomyces sp. JEL0837]
MKFIQPSLVSLAAVAGVASAAINVQDHPHQNARLVVIPAPNPPTSSSKLHTAQPMTPAEIVAPGIVPARNVTIASIVGGHLYFELNYNTTIDVVNIHNYPDLISRVSCNSSFSHGNTLLNVTADLSVIDSIRNWKLPMALMVQDVSCGVLSAEKCTGNGCLGQSCDFDSDCHDTFICKHKVCSHQPDLTPFMLSQISFSPPTSGFVQCLGKPFSTTQVQKYFGTPAYDIRTFNSTVTNNLVKRQATCKDSLLPPSYNCQDTIRIESTFSKTFSFKNTSDVAATIGVDGSYFKEEVAFTYPVPELGGSFNMGTLGISGDAGLWLTVDLVFDAILDIGINIPITLTMPAGSIKLLGDTHAHTPIMDVNFQADKTVDIGAEIKASATAELAFGLNIQFKGYNSKALIYANGTVTGNLGFGTDAQAKCPGSVFEADVGLHFISGAEIDIPAIPIVLKDGYHASLKFGEDSIPVAQYCSKPGCGNALLGEPECPHIGPGPVVLQPCDASKPCPKGACCASWAVPVLAMSAAEVGCLLGDNAVELHPANLDFVVANTVIAGREATSAGLDVWAGPALVLLHLAGCPLEGLAVNRVYVHQDCVVVNTDIAVPGTHTVERVVLEGPALAAMEALVVPLDLEVLPQVALAALQTPVHLDFAAANLDTAVPVTHTAARGALEGLALEDLAALALQPTVNIAVKIESQLFMSMSAPGGQTTLQVGQSVLNLQTTGNLVLYPAGKPGVWSSGTYGKGQGTVSFKVNMNGDLDINMNANSYGDGTNIWSSGTAAQFAPGGALAGVVDPNYNCLVLGSDLSLKLYDSTCRVLWSVGDSAGTPQTGGGNPSGYCGTGDAYCGAGCLGGSCTGGTSGGSGGSSGGVASGGSCSSSTLCASGLCCSQFAVALAERALEELGLVVLPRVALAALQPPVHLDFAEASLVIAERVTHIVEMAVKVEHVLAALVGLVLPVVFLQEGLADQERVHVKPDFAAANGAFAALGVTIAAPVASPPLGNADN